MFQLLVDPDLPVPDMAVSRQMKNGATQAFRALRRVESLTGGSRSPHAPQQHALARTLAAGPPRRRSTSAPRATDAGLSRFSSPHRSGVAQRERLMRSLLRNKKPPEIRGDAHVHQALPSLTLKNTAARYAPPSGRVFRAGRFLRAC